MFVVINNKDKSAIVLDGVIKRAREADEITPNFAMNILSQTNHRANIKTLVRAIRDKCETKEDLEPYKEFILSCVDGREISGVALASLQDMVEICGCRKEFDALDKKPKFYKEFDCCGTMTVHDYLIFLDVEDWASTLCFIDDDYIIQSADFSNITEFRFVKNAKLKFSDAVIWPKIIKFNSCKSVILSKNDFSKVDELIFYDVDDVSLCLINKFPKVLDVSGCELVNFSGSNLAGGEVIKFKDGGKVDFSSVKKFYNDLDFSKFSVVKAYNCDFSGVDEFNFRDGAQFHAMGSKNFTKILDFSKCSMVDLRKCNLVGVEEIKLGENTFISMDGVTNFIGKISTVKNNKLGKISSLYDK